VISWFSILAFTLNLYRYAEEEAERKHPIYLQIANRLREGNLELKQGVESLKDVIKVGLYKSNPVDDL
jgi:hypothetical protein